MTCRRCRWPPKHLSCRLPVVRSPKCGIPWNTLKRRCRCLIQFLLIIFVSLVLALWIGKRVQDRHVRGAPSTLTFYQQPHVCGIQMPPNYKNYIKTNNSSTQQQQQQVPPPLIQVETFDSDQKARNFSDSVIIGHCGDCGACSNPHDMLIYDLTRNTMLETAKHCAKRGLIFGRRTIGNCMDKHVGFTSSCNHCWIENMMCDLRLCVFTCLWNGMFARIHKTSNNSGRHELNPCTKCDELRCGPAFITCAGSNRRRSGILSDIERNNDQEVCSAVDKEWWRRSDVQEYYKLTQSYHPDSVVVKVIPSPTPTQESKVPPTRRKLRHS